MKELSTTFLLLFLLGITSCNQDENETVENCLDIATTASFTIDGTAFNVTHTPVWISNGVYQSLAFRHDIAGGGQQLVTIIFEGDSSGDYPLKGVSAAHKATYMGPNSNDNILFTGPEETGTLTITDIDLTEGCLTGSFAFTANFVQVSGEFQSLRTD